MFKDDIEDYSKNRILIAVLESPDIFKNSTVDNSVLGKEIDYDMNLQIAKNYIGCVWRILHGIPTACEYNSLDRNCDDYNFTKEYFYRNSILWRKRNILAPINSNLFKGRFLTGLSRSVRNNLGKMISDFIYYTQDKIDAKMKTDLLIQVIDCYSQFVLKMIKDENSSSEFDKMLQLFNLMIDGERRRKHKFTTTVTEQLENLRTISKNGILGRDFSVADSVVINNVCLLSYVVTTENVDIQSTFTTDPDIKFNDLEEVYKMIQTLGRTIVDYRALSSTYLISNAPDRISEIYKLFYSAKPLFRYRFREISCDLYLREGCRALSYLGFLAQSKTTNKILNKMIY